MNNQILSVVEREDLNLNNFSSLNTPILVSTIKDDLKTNLKDILFYLFQHKLKTKKLEQEFNLLFTETQNLLEIEINRLGHLTKNELIVWHSSVFMCLMSFKNSVESKYTLKNQKEIISLLKDIFENSFYNFLNYFSNKNKLTSNIQDKLCNEQVSEGFTYVSKKSNKRITVDTKSEINGIKMFERMLDVEYEPEKMKLGVE